MLSIDIDDEYEENINEENISEENIITADSSYENKMESSSTAKLKQGLAVNAEIGIIHFYQRYISPYKGGPVCKYTPSCSQYAAEAIKKYGAVRGSLLAFGRILRCNPISKGGYDPVP